MASESGFTLIELMIVIAILGILTTVATPSYRLYIQKGEIAEAVAMADAIKLNVTDYYQETLTFPEDNSEAGVPAAALLIGNRVSGVSVENGAVHVTMGNKVTAPIHGQVLTLRPAVVSGSPMSPISWLCGYDEPVTGMQAVGENKTTIPPEFLPPNCR